MADDVGQGFLHDAVGGQVGGLGQAVAGAVDGHLDGDPGRGRVGDQAVEVAEPGDRAQLGVVILGVAQHADQQPHLVQ